MTITTFHFHSTPTGKPNVMTLNAIDVAARYFVYKLYEATGGHPMQWQVLHGMGESATTISRAVERGWVVLQGVGGKPLDRRAALDRGEVQAQPARVAGENRAGPKGA